MLDVKDNSGLTLEFRGVRGSIPSPGPGTVRYGGNTSCVVLRDRDEVLILDAGSGIRTLGTDLSNEFGLRPIKATLLISHTHWDHIQGLPFFAPAYDAQNRIQILGTSPTLQTALQNQMKSIHFPVGLELMPGLAGIGQLDSARERLGSFDVETTRLNHPGGCTGFRISTRGMTVAYLPDHEPTYNTRSESSREALTRFIHGADVLILDTQYTEGEFAQRLGWGHGCLTESVRLAIDAGVSRFFLFHHDPAHDDDQIDNMVAVARQWATGAFSKLRIDAACEDEIITLLSGATLISSPSRLPASSGEFASPVFAQ